MIVWGHCMRCRRRHHSHKGGGRCGGVVAGRSRRCVRPRVSMRGCTSGLVRWWKTPWRRKPHTAPARRAKCASSAAHTAPCRSLARDRGRMQRRTVGAPPPPGAVRGRSDTKSPGQRSSRVRATREHRAGHRKSRIENLSPGSTPGPARALPGGCVRVMRACETHAFCRRRVSCAGVWKTRAPRAQSSRVAGGTMATRPAVLRRQRGAVMRGGVRPCVGPRPE